MVFRKCAVLLSSAALLASAMVTCQATSAEAKGKKAAKTSHTKHTAGRGQYFVPPPPPYTPSILPEHRAFYQQGQTQVVATDEEEADKTPANPYSKYIFTRKEEDMPRVVQPNPYVSYYPKKGT